MAIIGIDLGTSNFTASVLHNGTGDLYVRVQLQVLQQPPPQEQALYRQLRSLTRGSR